MSFHPAEPAEAAAIDAFLAPLSETSMFLRSNIRAHGVCGGEADIATRVWLDREAGEIVGAIGLTTGGMVLLQMPGAAPRGMARAADALAGASVRGITGAADQVRTFCTATGLDPASAILARDEALYALDLGDLCIPPGPGRIRPPGSADLPLLEEWRTAYHVEALGTPPEVAAAWARRDVARLTEAGTCRLLVADRVPLGKTALNAALPEIVQVGGVYTPPEHRGRGYARRAVALHLAELRGAGVRRAVLFSDLPAARRAYEAVGFRRVGSYGLVLFAEPAAIGPAA